MMRCPFVVSERLYRYITIPAICTMWICWFSFMVLAARGQ